jgi:hypothetical protein
MNITPLPAKFAVNTNYSTGPDTGTATKLDPSGSGNGFVKGTGINPQNINFLFNQPVPLLRHLFLQMAAYLGQSAAGYLDLDSSVGACQMPDGRLLAERFDSSAPGLILTDWGGVQRAGDFTGTSTPITSAVTDMASDGTHVLLIGSGGNCNAYSSNNGTSWTTGGFLATNGPRTRLVWNANKSRWHATGPANGSVFTNTAVPTSAWSSEASGVPAPDGLGVLSNGNLYVLGDNGVDPDPVIRVSTDAAASFANDGAQIPNANTYAESGCLVGNGGSALYHAGRIGTGTLAVCRRTAVAGWALCASFSNLNTGLTSFDARPRILMCPQTGLLVMVCTVNGSKGTAIFASPDGTDWVGPLVASPVIDVDGFAIAAGKLIGSTDELLLYSDGVGQLGFL